MEKKPVDHPQPTEKSPQDTLTHFESKYNETIAQTVVDSKRTMGQVGSNSRRIHIPGYDVLFKLGEGGMGSVYLATDQKLGRQVAIKVISNAALKSKRAVKRFMNEIKSVAALKHNNIAQLYSAGEQEGMPYFVMEFVDGTPLDERLKEQPMEPAAAAELVCKLALAMQHCHESGIIHRDLKPSNILMDQDNEPKIADFGLAKSTQNEIDTTKTGEVIGTPAYMAPEQAKGDHGEVGSATDVYGLGAILYHAITGRMPFSDPNVAITISNVISEDPIDPRKLQRAIPKDLETICLKCLAKAGNRRYESTRALANDLERFLNSEPILARPVSVVERGTKWAKRRPALASLVTMMALGIPLAFAGMIYHTNSLETALSGQRQALKKLDLEYQKSRRLSDGASDLTTWLMQNHQSNVSQLHGSLPIVNSLQKRIKEYLDDVINDMPNESKSLRRWANVYSNLAVSLGGENSSSYGKEAEAMKLFEQSLEMFDRALAEDPSDVSAMNLKAKTALDMADLQFSRGQTDASRDLVELAEKILDSNAADMSSDRRLLKLFVLQSRFDQLSSAQQFNKALELLQQFENGIGKGPEDALDSAEAEHQLIWKLQKQTMILNSQGLYDEALEVALRNLEIAKSSYDKNSQNPKALNRYANALSNLSDIWSYKRDHERGLEFLLQVVELREKHFSKNSQDVMSQYNLANALSSVSAAYMQIPDPKRQLEFANQSMKMFSSLATRIPGNRSYQIRLAMSHRDVGSALAQNSQFESAVDAFKSAVEIVEALNEERIDSVALNAELNLQSGMIFFQRLMSDGSIFGSGNVNVREKKDFQLAIKSLDRSLELFENAKEFGELNYQQQYLRDKAGQAKAMVIETAEKLEATNTDSSP